MKKLHTILSENNFNSIKVQLELHCYLDLSIIGIYYFNSIKVQLELASVGNNVSGNLHFNSIKVQLERSWSLRIGIAVTCISIP